MSGGYVAYIGPKESGRLGKKVPSGSATVYNFPAMREDKTTGERVPVYVDVPDEVDYSYFVWYAKANPGEWKTKTRLSAKDLSVSGLDKARKDFDEKDPNAEADFERKKAQENFKMIDEGMRKIRIQLVEPEKRKELLKHLKDLEAKLGGDK